MRPLYLAAAFTAGALLAGCSAKENRGGRARAPVIPSAARDLLQYPRQWRRSEHAAKVPRSARDNSPLTAMPHLPC